MSDQKISDEQISRIDLTKPTAAFDVADLIADLCAARAALAERDEMIAKLRDVLQDLLDHQNGPPLPSYEEGWTAAVENARALLDQKENRADPDELKAIDLLHRLRRLMRPTRGDFCSAECLGQCNDCKLLAEVDAFLKTLAESDVAPLPRLIEECWAGRSSGRTGR